MIFFFLSFFLPDAYSQIGKFLYHFPGEARMKCKCILVGVEEELRTPREV